RARLVTPIEPAMATHLSSPETSATPDSIARTAREIAQLVLEGFDRHYAVFRECARAAKRHFEAGNWLAIQHVAGDRIDFYDRRVLEAAGKIGADYRFSGFSLPD